MSEQLKIAVCLFGITRSLRYTLPSIESNVFAPARNFGRVYLHGHFFNQRNIYNSRSDEINIPVKSEHELIQFSSLVVEDPGSEQVTELERRLKNYGDHWDDGGASLRNICHQLVSLSRVTSQALNAGCDVVAFCRPDLLYLDSFHNLFFEAAKSRGDEVFLPFWQCAHGGYNDRFAVCAGQKAIEAYGHRYHFAEDFCLTYRRPLHSELFLRSKLQAHELKIVGVSQRAVRIRSTGAPAVEVFQRNWAKTRFSLLRLKIRAIVKGLRQ